MKASPVLAAYERKLLRQLGERVRPLGFAPQPKEQAFYKDVPGGRWILHVAFIEHELDLDVTGDVAIRLDAVEDLVNADNTLLSPAERRLTATAGAELGNIADRRQKRFVVQSDSDTEQVANELAREFERFGLPYLQRLSSPEALLDALSRNDAASWLHSPIHSSRCVRAVALAITLGDHAKARAVTQSCRSFLEEKRDPGLKAFERFVERAVPVAE